MWKGYLNVMAKAGMAVRRRGAGRSPPLSDPGGMCYQHVQASRWRNRSPPKHGNRRIRLHGSVRLFHAQLLTKPAPTFRVSHETNEFCTTPFFIRQRQSPETRLVHHHSIQTNTKGCSHAQAFLLNRHRRTGDCCCSAYCVVACRYAIASDHCVIVDQPHRDDGNLQGSATS